MAAVLIFNLILAFILAYYIRRARRAARKLEGVSFGEISEYRAAVHHLTRKVAFLAEDKARIENAVESFCKPDNWHMDIWETPRFIFEEFDYKFIWIGNKFHPAAVLQELVFGGYFCFQCEQNGVSKEERFCEGKPYAYDIATGLPICEDCAEFINDEMRAKHEPPNDFYFREEETNDGYEV